MLRATALILMIMFFGCKQPKSSVVDEVKVVFKNQSTQEVKHITLTHEKGSIERGEVEIGGEIIVLFHCPGECAYQAEIMLANGKTLQSGTYVERGYMITETIYDDSVKTQYNFYNSKLR